MSDQIILFPGEAEKMVESLKPMLPDMVGRQEWYRQQDYIDKLNVQAILSASNQSDEFIKEFLITYQKVDVLVECVICMETWRENVLSRVILEDHIPDQTFGLYGLLYGEATMVTLLETVLYHSDSMSCLDKGLLDLVDYCHRAVTSLLFHCDDMKYRRMIYGSLKTPEHQSYRQEIEHHQRVISYQIALKCLSILHYLIDNVSILPLSVASRLYSTFDVPLLLAEVVYKSPWIVELADGKIAKFIDNKWVTQDNWIDLRNNISKLQGQVWLSIYQLLLSQQCREKYDFSGHRKTALLKLRSFLSDVIIDQLPMLGDLRRFLEQLSLTEPGNVKANLVLEQVAEFRDTILHEYEHKWDNVYQSFLAYLTSPDWQEDLMRQAKSWSDTYNLDTIDHLISDAPKCPVCGKEAAKRCSRCKNEWYCRRECQVQHWQKHKKTCDLFVNNNQ